MQIDPIIKVWSIERGRRCIFLRFRELAEDLPGSKLSVSAFAVTSCFQFLSIMESVNFSDGSAAESKYLYLSSEEHVWISRNAKWFLCVRLITQCQSIFIYQWIMKVFGQIIYHMMFVNVSCVAAASKNLAEVQLWRVKHNGRGLRLSRGSPKKCKKINIFFTE